MPAGMSNQQKSLACLSSPLLSALCISTTSENTRWRCSAVALWLIRNLGAIGTLRWTGLSRGIFENSKIQEVDGLNWLVV